MKIGIMLRHIGQHGGGVLVYTHSLLREMLDLGGGHEYVLLYQDRKMVGAYGTSDAIREVVVEAPCSLLWDQVAVRQVEKSEKLDVLFNPKYSIPLMASCRTVFVCHGLDWYVMPWGSKWIDRLSHRFLVPRYAQKADAIICVSETTRQHAIDYLGVDKDKLHTIYLGVDEWFRKPLPAEKLEEIRKTYQLPSRFLLYCGQIYPPKNFARLLRAYSRVGPELGVHLVVAGQHTWLCEKDLQLVEQLGISRWVIRSGWIGRDVLPAFYALAEGLVLPSLYEACPSPILEAMATGCPIVTANRYGTKELVGQAGILVDPEDVESIAAGMRRIVAEPELRGRLVTAGADRVTRFSWRKCAQETLRVLENTVVAA